MHDPVAQAQANLDQWMSRRWRRGESAHWRKFNPRIASLDDLTTFRARNAEGGDVRLGLDDTRLDQHDLTSLIFQRLVSKWGIECVRPLIESSIGRPPTTTIIPADGDPVVVDFHDLHLINFALDLHNALTRHAQSQPHPILEIGAGYGGTVAKLAQLMPTTKFVVADLPPAGLLQAYYLNRHFPGEVGVAPLGALFASSCRFLICSGEDLRQHPTEYQAVVNTRSFQEMERPTVKRYFSLIQDSLCTDGILLNVNRLAKIGYRFGDYPYDDRWTCVRSEPAFMQPGIWNLVTRRLDQANPDFRMWSNSLPRTHWSMPRQLRPISRPLRWVSRKLPKLVPACFRP